MQDTTCGQDPKRGDSLSDALTLTESETGEDLILRLLIGDVEGDTENDDEPTDKYHITAESFEWMAFVCKRLAGRLRGED